MSEQGQGQGQNEPESANYKQVSSLVDKWLEVHKDETFKQDDVCKQLEITSRDGRQLVAIKLNYEASKPGKKLEKLNRIYRYINTNKRTIDWVNASDDPVLDIRWPYGIEDDSHFGFDGCIQISPGDIIVNAGVSNTGKTTFALNFLWMNMDLHPCLLMGNEYTPTKFKLMAGRMAELGNPLKEDGTPKFELIERHTAWQDIIEPNAINIIDWINLNDNFFQIGSIIEGIKSKLANGIVLICLQKGSEKILAIGGDFSLHLASLYLTMDFGRMTVIKAKAYNGHNPNNEVYGFKIVNYGTRFHDIRKIKRCPKCYKFINKQCQVCSGLGWIDANE